MKKDIPKGLVRIRQWFLYDWTIHPCQIYQYICQKQHNIRTYKSNIKLWSFISITCNQSDQSSIWKNIMHEINCTFCVSYFQCMFPSMCKLTAQNKKDLTFNPPRRNKQYRVCGRALYPFLQYIMLWLFLGGVLPLLFLMPLKAPKKLGQIPHAGINIKLAKWVFSCKNKGI